MIAPYLVMAPFAFSCDGVVHVFSTAAASLTEKCGCPPRLTGSPELCPTCGGKGFTLADDGDGHKDEIDCTRCAHLRSDR
jgi:hypothetical protein